MGDILDRARRAGCPASLAADYGRDVCGLVAAICRELSLASDDRRFWLDSRTLARLCGIDQPKASACLRALTGSRAIRRVAEPRPGRASEYVWLLP